MALLDQARLIQDADFRDKVFAALVKIGTDVLNEDAATEHHQARVRLANDVIQSPRMMVDRYIVHFLRNPAVQGQAATPDAISDNDILYITASFWNEWVALGGYQEKTIPSN